MCTLSNFVETIKRNKSNNIILLIHSFIPLDLISLSRTGDIIRIGKAVNKNNEDFVYGSEAEQAA